ncbi:MAG: Gfo/Idh/MocA family oxidoreductase [Anaerolineae bacterium]|nr:Gfo/Idh/MocA family oxidoreductase [Thermoflexales bacterium]MDW8408242.1 Gfo/Idh/MocA family oxidoreductase [Anaerolineae bacterium]
MDKAHIALVGAGWWGTYAHIPALKHHPRAELVAVQSRSREKAEQIAADFGVPFACVALEETLAIEGLNGVIISTTPNVHYEQARAALERGLHTLIEKPMTITAAEAGELVALARRKKVCCLIGCPWHYNRHAIEARRLIRTGALGEVKMVTMLFTNNTAGLYRGLSLDKAFGIDAQKNPERLPYRMPGLGSYSDPAVAGGGHIYTQISHLAALLGFLIESDPVEVFARFDNAGGALDVYDAISVRLANGALASLMSHGEPMPGHAQCDIHIHGRQGAIHLDLHAGTLVFYGADGQQMAYPTLPAGERYPLYAPAQNLVDCVLGTAENGSPGELGWYAMRVIEAASRSARRGENVMVPVVVE